MTTPPRPARPDPATVRDWLSGDDRPRLVDGALVVAAMLASLAIPGLRWFAAVIGAGLAVAARTNTCLMGNLLARLPFNRAARCDVDAVVRRLADARPARS